MMRIGLAVAGAAIVIFAAWFGLTRLLGAHPWWSLNVALIGAPPGAAMAALIPHRRCVTALTGAIVLTVAAFAVARYGGMEFAASFAENARAGQMWFLGWIGTCVGVGAVVTLALRGAAGR